MYIILILILRGFPNGFVCVVFVVGFLLTNRLGAPKPTNKRSLNMWLLIGTPGLPNKTWPTDLSIASGNSKS